MIESNFSERIRRPGFTRLRLFAALAVMGQHARSHLTPSALWWPDHPNLWFDDGVALFFVMSAFLVPESYRRFRENSPSLKAALERYGFARARRIYPALFACAAGSVLLLIVIGQVAPFEFYRLPMLAWFAGMISGFGVIHPARLRSVGMGVWNGSLWTIPVELQFYCLVPVIVEVSRRWQRSRRWIAGAAAAVAGPPAAIALEHLGAPHKALLITLLPYAPMFAAGLIACAAARRIPLARSAAILAGMVAVIVYIAVVVVNLPVEWRAVPLGLFVYSLAVFGNSTQRTQSPRGLRSRWDISYGIYLWQMPVLNSLLSVTGSERGHAPAWTFPALIAISILFGILSWMFIELPWLQRGKGRDKRS